MNGPAYGEGFGLVSRDGRETHLASAPLLFAALEKLLTPPGASATARTVSKKRRAG